MNQIRTTALLLGLLAAPALSQEAASTAGHARARHLAELGRLPTAGDIIVEDLINYHRHQLAMPRAGQAVALDLRWSGERFGRRAPAILQIGIATPHINDREHLPPINLALVIDRSGSMADDGKMNRVKEALRRFVRELRPVDRVALIAYNHGAEVLLPSRRVGKGEALLDAIERLQPDGYTNLHAGLMLGYEEVARSLDREGSNRVILLTDGLANRGITLPQEILSDSRRFNSRGIDLSTIGVGTNFNRDLLQKLSSGGRGLFHFVADGRDIHKVFVAEIQSLVAPIARNARLELRIDPGLRLEQVYGYAPRREGRHVEIPLTDMNYGLTQVVLLRFARTGAAEWDSESDGWRSEREAPRGRLGVDVRLSYDSVESGERVTETRRATLAPAAERSTAALRDHEVSKNYTIARMAQALHEMAAATERKNLGAAERIVGRALAFAERRYPSTQDQDLIRVLDMLRQYRKTIRARIECFRDL